MKKESYIKNPYNNRTNIIKINNINCNYNNNDFMIHKDKNYSKYNKTTTQIKSNEYNKQKLGINEFSIGKEFIDLNDKNKIFSKSSDKKKKNNVQYNNKKNSKLKLSNNPYSYKKKIIFNNITNNINSNNFKVLNNYSNNIDLIIKKKELEEQRERERKIMEWFYISDINISKRDLYDALSTLIQSVFRGWSFRAKNKIRIKICILKLNQIFLKEYRNILEIFFYKLKINCKKKYKFNEVNENEKELMNEEIKELIKQNNELRKKLGNILYENKNLKNEAKNYKIYKNKYKEIFEQIEKMHNINNNIIEENQNLKDELNKLALKGSNNKDRHEENYDNNNNYIIDKLKLINYCQMNNKKKFTNKETQYDIDLDSNKNLYFNSFKIQNLNQINIYPNNNPSTNLICKENSINLISIGLKNKTINIEQGFNNELNIYKNKLKNLIIKKNIYNKSIKCKDKLKDTFYKYQNINKNFKIKELEDELFLLKKEKNNNINEENNILKQKKLKTIFKFKSSTLKNELCKYFLSFYYKCLTSKFQNMIQLENQNIIPIQPIHISPIIPEEPNAIPGVSSIPVVKREIPSNKESKDNIEINDKQGELIKIIKEKEEKESKEEKARIIKSRNLRKILNKKVREKKDNLRKYFYKYQHITMMVKIRSKLIEIKRKEMEKTIKEEKIENAKYHLIQLQRNKQQRLASLFNKLDRKISQIKRTVIEAWNMKAKVMSIKTILKPLKNKPKKKKKKVKKEEDSNHDIIKDKN